MLKSKLQDLLLFQNGSNDLWFTKIKFRKDPAKHSVVSHGKVV